MNRLFLYRYLYITRGDEWSIKIFNCSQNLNRVLACSCSPNFCVARKLAKQIFYFCSCSQKDRSARHARECSQRPFVTPITYKRFGSHTLTCICYSYHRFASMLHPPTMDVWIMLLGLLSSYCLILKNFSGNLSPFLNLVSIPLKAKLCRFVRSIDILGNLGMEL